MRASPTRCSARAPIDLAVVNGPGVASGADVGGAEHGAELRAARLVRPRGDVRPPRHRAVGPGLAAADARAADGRPDRRARRPSGSSARRCWGASDLGLSALFAATYPERVTALVLSSVSPEGVTAMTPELREQFLDAIENHWGDGTLLLVYAPSQVGNRGFEEWWGRMQRSAVSPGMARQLMEMIAQTDLHGAAADDPGADAGHPPARTIAYIPVELGREVGAADPRRPLRRVSRARTPTAGSTRRRSTDVEEFLTGRRRRPGGRPRAGHRDVHRHRRLDRARLAARRRPLADAAGRAQRRRPRRARALARHRGQDDRRRVPGHVRRPGARRALRGGDRRRRSTRSACGSGPACTPASASWSATTWPGSPCTSARA